MNRIRMRAPPPLQQLAERSANMGSATKASTVRAMRVPKFLRSLYDILHYEDQMILTWSKDGTFFQIFDTKRLEVVVLPKYFKHGKFASFQRQLNNFGFRKWTKTQSSVCTFSHHHLVRCHPQELAEFISRRPATVGARPAAEAFTARRKRTFTDLMRAPGMAEIGTAKTIKRENGGYSRDLQTTESSMMDAAHSGTAKCMPRWSTDPMGFMKSSEDNYGTSTSCSSGPPEQPFNFTVEELHDIILPSERQESRSSEKILEMRMLNDCLELGVAGSPYASANHPGAELFPYWWDSDTFFAPVNRAHFDQERSPWKLGH